MPEEVPEPEPSAGEDPEPLEIPGPPGMGDADPSTFFDDPDAWAIPVPDIPLPRRRVGTEAPPEDHEHAPALVQEPAPDIGPPEPSSAEAPAEEEEPLVELTVEPIPAVPPAPPEHEAYAPKHSPLRRPPLEDAPPSVLEGAPPMPSEAPPLPSGPQEGGADEQASPDPAGLVDEVFGPERHRKVRQPGDGRVVAVMAGKGGYGKTVIAVNTALAVLEAIGRESVALVDADLQFGDVALLLQLDPSTTIAEVAPTSEGLSPEKLDSMLTRHESGLRVLPAPLIPSRASVRPKDVARVIDYLETLPFVDKRRIGSIGHSHGAYGTLMAAAFEPRISAAIASCGFTTFRTDPRPERWSHLTALWPQLGAYLPDVASIPFDWQHICALIAPRPLYVWYTTKDGVFPNTDNLDALQDSSCQALGRGGRVTSVGDFPAPAFPVYFPMGQGD